MVSPAAPVMPTPGLQGLNEMKQKSDNITKQLDAMPEIDKVNVLVTGDTCLVGYSPANAQGDPNARKNMVIEKVKQIDPTLNNVVVSESQDVMNRINQLINDMANNKSMDEINREVMQLIKTTVPSAS
jgi:spore cortex protein